MSRRRRWALRLGAIAASTALCALYATARAPWHWLGWVALVPWLLGQDASERARPAMLDAWLFTMAFTGAALWWFPVVIQRYTAIPAAVCWLLYLGLAPLLQPQLLAYAAVRRSAGRAAGVLAYVGVEWAYPKLIADTFGYPLYPAEDVRQVADLGGVWVLTLLLLSVNEVLAAAARDRRPRRLALAAAVCVAAIAGPAAYGRFRRAQLAAASTPAFTAGLVQSNLTRYAELAAREGTFEAAVRILEVHRALSLALAARGKLDLLVWAETAYPAVYGAPQSEEGAELDAEIQRLTLELSTPLLFGTYESEAGREYNAAVLLAPGGAKLGAYRKVRLFPLTERVPFWLEGARGAMPWMGTWTPGPGAALLRLPLRGGGEVNVAPLICYDVLDPSLVASARQLGAQALLTISNDSWFSGTPAVELHLIGAAFRSIETRLPQARATPSGITASISAAGDILWRAEPDRPGGVIAELAVAPNLPRAPAARWGPWTGPASLLGAVAVLAAGRLRRGRRRGDPLLPVLHRKDHP